VIVLNTHEAKTHFSRYLELVEKGEVIVICRRNQPVAELRAVQPLRVEPRPIGLAAGDFEVTDAFFDPLPDDLLAAFTAKSSL
jgi:prevent-host-death family protein